MKNLKLTKDEFIELMEIVGHATPIKPTVMDMMNPEMYEQRKETRTNLVLKLVELNIEENK